MEVTIKGEIRRIQVPFFVEFIYDESNQAQGCILNGDAGYLFVRNLQGDVIALADMEGRVMIEYNYDPWGKISYIYFDENGNPSNEIADESLQMITAIFCPLTYRGYNYDFTTGLYYLQSRYYNPEWGRFLNCDDTSILLATQGETHGANLYVYCENNPTNKTDITGKKSEKSEQLPKDLACYLSCVIFFDNFIIGIDNHKKGTIKIDIKKGNYDYKGQYAQFSDQLFILYKNYGDYIFDVMAEFTNEKFRKEFPVYYVVKYGEATARRNFLFSNECLSTEIKYHCITQWDMRGKLFFRPTHLSIGNGAKVTIDYFVQNGKEHGAKIWEWEAENLGPKWVESTINSCNVIDICEQDANTPRDRIAFGYFGGIRNEYKNTLSDPFYFPQQRTRKHSVREDWIDMKLGE